MSALLGVGPATATTSPARAGRRSAASPTRPCQAVQRVLGAKAGRTLHARAHGVDDRPAIHQAAPPPPLPTTASPATNSTPAQHRRALLVLSEQLGERLRNRGQAARP
ncbi:hypothetical protein [Streptomyces sp. NPDC001970]